MFKKLIALVILAAILISAAYFYLLSRENAILKKVIERLSADSRAAEVIVTNISAGPATGPRRTTIKFVEYDALNNAMPARYFTFSGEMIQFQSMVIRFDDYLVKNGDRLRGKSAYLFMKAFMLTDNGVEAFDIAKVNEIPQGYAVEGRGSGFEKKLWRSFWAYALDPERAKRAGIKNAQIEAPGTRFMPGMFYTIKIEHDGGLRIDSRPLPRILSGERVPFLRSKNDPERAQ